MDEIISLVVANGIFAVLFCGLLVYELRDSRSREDNYKKIIGTLGDRLKTVDDVKSDTEEIKADIAEIRTDVKILCAGAERKKRLSANRAQQQCGGGQCSATTTA
ncbi:MAG: hypothetical protein K2M47_07250 [Clostridiales bacterium]|nr:hypothetical protein [Clostridiales bacterium]